MIQRSWSQSRLFNHHFVEKRTIFIYFRCEISEVLVYVCIVYVQLLWDIFLENKVSDA